MSSAAFDAAIGLAETGRYQAQLLLTVRARAVVGRAIAGGAAGHWSEQAGRERLAEVVGRMPLGGGAGEREVLKAALLRRR